MKKLLVALLEKSIQANIDGGGLSVAELPPIEMELTKDPRTRGLCLQCSHDTGRAGKKESS